MTEALHKWNPETDSWRLCGFITNPLTPQPTGAKLNIWQEINREDNGAKPACNSSEILPPARRGCIDRTEFGRGESRLGLFHRRAESPSACYRNGFIDRMIETQKPGVGPRVAQRGDQNSRRSPAPNAIGGTRNYGRIVQPPAVESDLAELF